MTWDRWVLAVHVLCAVIWVGGMFFAYVVLRPSLSVLEPMQRIALHTQVFRRFFLIVWHVMPLILLPGFGVLFGFYGGPAKVRWNISVMMLFGLIIMFLVGARWPLINNASSGEFVGDGWGHRWYYCSLSLSSSRVS